MANAGQCCSSPQWVPRRKHWTSSKKLWDASTIVTQTAEPKQPARYSAHLTPPQIEQIEMGTVGHNALPRPHSHVQPFYRDMGTIIGASEGKTTSFVYVECTANGFVHGRPITWEELVGNKGA